MGIGFEYAMMAAVLLGIATVAMSFRSTGYLPPPFFYAPDDTFMDWYNTAYWSHTRGAYDEWRTVYPPLSFLFLKIFSVGPCYDMAPDVARRCDPVGIWTLCGILVLNGLLVFRAYGRLDRTTAIARTVAVAFGMPMLYAWERGNLILPCFTFVVLGHGRVLKSAWMRWLAIAFAINFKPYLLFLSVGQIVRMRWRWIEGCGLVLLCVYLATFGLFGAGTPRELIENTIVFSARSADDSLNGSIFSSSFTSILDVFNSKLPIVDFVGSWTAEAVKFILPKLILLVEGGVAICFAGALLKPQALSASRMGALAMAFLLATTNPGGYAEVFLLFFVFVERRRGGFMTMTLLAAYALCIPFDIPIVKIVHDVQDSYLSGRAVGHDTSVNLGQFIRPGFVLLIAYGLIGASLTDLLKRGAGPGVVARAPGPTRGATASPLPAE